MSNPEAYRKLASFMLERHNIYLARQAGKPWPWTADAILQQYRFCNIFRELDTVTVWIDENIRKPFADHEHLWLMLAIARRINLPATLAELIDDKKGAWPRRHFDPQRLLEVLDARTARGDQVYTGAYMVTAESGAHAVGQTKSRTTAFASIDPLWQKRASIRPRLNNSLKEAFDAVLGQGFAWGRFMTYELVTDLRHTRYLRSAPDTMTWANAGPGALRGLSRLGWGSPPKTRWANASVSGAAGLRLSDEDALKFMRILLKEVSKLWPKRAGFPKLELRDIEHSLCEFDKYERVRNGEGRPRSLYKPPSHRS